MKGYFILAALLGGGTWLLVVDTLDASTTHSFEVGQFLAEPVWDEPVLVHGTLVLGSLSREPSDRCGYRFDLVDSSLGNRTTPQPEGLLSVDLQGCIVPDTFGDYEQGLDVDVTVLGQRYRGCHDFQASTILARAMF